MEKTEKEGKIADLPRQVITAIQSASDKKAADIIVLDLRNAGGFTDYFIICTGQNTRQIKAIADAVEQSLHKELDEKPVIAEGTEKLFEKIKSGQIKVKIFKKYKLEEVVQAHKDLESRKIIGPAVIIP